MHEVEVRAVGDALEERVRPDRLDRIPADVGQRGRVQECDRSAGKQAKRLCVGLVAGVEEELEAQADAEARPAGSDPVTKRLEQAVFAQVIHCRPGGPNTGHDDRVHVGESRRFGGHDNVGPNRCQGLADADHVRGAVIEDRDLDRATHPSVPLVEAGPWRRGSTVTAAHSARPSALKAASARWWSFRPRPLRLSVTPAARANDSSVCSISSSGILPARLPLNGRSMTAYGRPPTSTTAVAKASSMGTAASPKRTIPERSPSACASAAPRTSATSSTVWCSSMMRSPLASISRSKRAWWAMEFSRWS